MPSREVAATRPDTPLLLQATGLTARRQGRLVLDRVSLSLVAGECLALCGPSGCGKTTLLRALAGLDPVDSGTVLLDGAIRNAPGKRDCGRGEVGMVFQGEQLYRHLSLLDNITIAPRLVHGVPRPEAEAAARRLLESIGLADKAGQHPGQLSGGERQRGAIARALALSPRLMLFDEPTSSLDPSCVREVLALVRRIREQGQTMIVVTHQTGFARSIADRIAVMEAGRIVESGDPAQVVLQAQTAVTRELFCSGLPDLSALDRIRLAGVLTVGLAAKSPEPATNLLDCPQVARLVDRLGCAPMFRRLDCAPPLALRLGLADLFLLERQETDPDLVLLADCPALPAGWALAAAASDALWLRELDWMRPVAGRFRS